MHISRINTQLLGYVTHSATDNILQGTPTVWSDYHVSHIYVSKICAYYPIWQNQMFENLHYFGVLLTVHLSKIFVINQLNGQILLL